MYDRWAEPLPPWWRGVYLARLADPGWRLAPLPAWALARVEAMQAEQAEERRRLRAERKLAREQRKKERAGGRAA